MASYSDHEDVMGSDEVREMFCEECNLEGRNALATGFCSTCHDYMCDVCMKYHIKYKSNHKILSKDDMPTEVCFEKCPKHSNRLLKFYCEFCKGFSCSECRRSGSDSCANDVHRWQHVPTVVENIDSTNLYEKLIENFDATKQKLLAVQEKTALNKKCNEKYHEKATKNLRKQILKYTNSMAETEAHLSDEIEKKRSKNEAKIGAICKYLETLTPELNTIEKNIQKRKEDGHRASMFISYVQNKESIMQIERKLHDLETANNINVYKFEATDAELPSKIFGIVSVGQAKEVVKVEADAVAGFKIPDLKSRLRSGDVDGICFVKDVFAVIVSYVCKAVRVYSLDTNKELFSYSTPEEPFGISSLNDDQIAVSLFDKNRGWIYIFAISDSGQLIKTSEVYTETGCWDLTQFQDLKILTVHECPLCHINIIDTTGKVLKRISSRDTQGKQLFRSLRNVVLSTDKTMMYLTDFGANAVIKMNMKGELLKIYTDTELKGPKGITVDEDGLLYVCGLFTNNIHVLSKEMQKYTVIRDVKVPRSVGYNSKDRLLYIGLEKCSTLMRFRVVKTYSET